LAKTDEDDHAEIAGHGMIRRSSLLDVTANSLVRFVLLFSFAALAFAIGGALWIGRPVERKILAAGAIF
jgi:hypothetical protein